MAATIWKGHLTFGLISVPVKLVRAARAEKVSFRQLHGADYSRVRQTYVRDPEPEVRGSAEIEEINEIEEAPVRTGAKPAPAPAVAAMRAQPQAIPLPQGPAPPPQAPQPVSRQDLVKGYEIARDRYVVVTKEDLAKITAENSREMQILEFVRLAEIDPVYFETSYYVVPDRAGERAYALLLEALRRTGFTAVARLAMHNREHVVVVRPGRTGMILHTLFFEDEVRREDEYRTDTAGVNTKELELAVRLVESLASPFDASKYKDTYREKLQELIQAKLAGEQTHEAPAPKPAPVIDILQALERSLAMTERKPAASEKAAASRPRATGKRGGGKR
jgi:DNA end-binding protein Ku